MMPNVRNGACTTFVGQGEERRQLNAANDHAPLRCYIMAAVALQNDTNTFQKIAPTSQAHKVKN